jgi:hypothetical protein
MTESTSKVSLLKNIALTVVTSIMLVLIGYWLNSWLSRESLSIEYVRFISEIQVQLPFKQIEPKLHDLRLNSRFQIWNNEPGSFVGTPGCPMALHPDNPNFTRETVKWLQSCLESFADNNEEDTKYLIKSSSALEKNPDQAVLNSILANILNGTSFSQGADEVFKEPPQRKLQSTKRLLKDAIADSVEAGRLTSDSLEILKQLKAVPTGRVLVVATIRNSGDTDGLIMSAPENCLILNKNAGRLPIKLVGQFNASTGRFPPRSSALADTVVSITKRGAASVAFILDPSLLPEPPRVAVTDVIKEYQYSDLQGKIILKDMRNRDIESREFPFPSSSQDQ